jgi:hypothetical protein
MPTSLKKLLSEGELPMGGTDSRMTSEAAMWVEQLIFYAEKARAEITKKKEPGMAMDLLVTQMRGLKSNDWFERFYG